MGCEVQFRVSFPFCYNVFNTVMHIFLTQIKSFKMFQKGGGRETEKIIVKRRKRKTQKIGRKKINRWQNLVKLGLIHLHTNETESNCQDVKIFT